DACDVIGAEGAGEVRGVGHDTGLGIEFQLDLNLVAGHHAGGLSVGVAEAKQVAATHDRDSALPGMPIDRDRDPRPLALAKRLHNLRGNLQPPHGLGRLDVGSELHDLPPLGSMVPHKTDERRLKGQMQHAKMTSSRSSSVAADPGQSRDCARSATSQARGLDGLPSAAFGSHVAAGAKLGRVRSRTWDLVVARWQPSSLTIYA